MLQPSNYENEIDERTETTRTYWIIDHHHYLSDVKVQYKLYPFESEIIPYFIYPYTIDLTLLPERVALSEMIEINGREWYHIETEPDYFESDG